MLCTDEYIKDPSFVDAKTIADKSDILIVATPHKQYTDLNLTGKVVIDIWNLFKQGGKV